MKFEWGYALFKQERIQTFEMGNVTHVFTKVTLLRTGNFNVNVFLTIASPMQLCSQ